jgi:hypothetical protein
MHTKSHGRARAAAQNSRVQRQASWDSRDVAKVNDARTTSRDATETHALARPNVVETTTAVDLVRQLSNPRRHRYAR